MQIDLAAFNLDPGFVPEAIYAAFSPEGSRLVLPVKLMMICEF